MQKIMNLCNCPVDVCRADKPPEECRYVMDPHDKLREIKAKPMTTQDDVKGPERIWVDKFYPIPYKNDMGFASVKKIEGYRLEYVRSDVFDQAQRQLEMNRALVRDLTTALNNKNSEIAEVKEERDRYRDVLKHIDKWEDGAIREIFIWVKEALQPQPTTPDSGGGGG